ncbi:MAG: NAD(P)/FAD-dependent oxidoreductase, partial [Roseiarcus sp.]
EAVVTAGGLEGGAIYALSASLRAAIEAEGAADLLLDFKPDASFEALARRLVRSPGQSLPTFLRKAVSLSPVAISLLREAGSIPNDPAGLAARLKACPLRVVGAAPIARAISSAGGVEWSEIDENFMLRARPGVFVAGEMIDWEAPQGAFATGAAAGTGAARWLAR